MPPRILPRSEHTLSRKNIDPEALKVLYRLKDRGFLAYLVGGGVRDLLLGRRPKDFDVCTNAHPQQVKKLFRNCFIVGRRFRLCHVRFERKVVEVSTFRRQAPEAEDGDTLIRRDNTFGTPEEDAFRRDFTVNALFYDIATFSIIDYVGGLEDLESRLIRTIGDPGVRLREDPVRMLRAVALAARLSFLIDRDTLDAVRALRGEIVRSSPSRLIEEFYKILRQGAARATFQLLHEVGLLAYLMPAIDQALAGGGAKALASLARLDDYRNAGRVAPEELSNALLAGTLLVPLGAPLRPSARPQREFRDRAAAEAALDVAAELEALGHAAADAEEAPDEAPHDVLALPFARRDFDRLRLILLAQTRLREIHRSPRVKHLLAGRTYFEDALRWMEIHGGLEDQELVAHWRSLDFSDVAPPAHGGRGSRGAQAAAAEPTDEGEDAPAQAVRGGRGALGAPAASKPEGARRARRGGRRRRRRGGGGARGGPATPPETAGS
jgi:poly(A) polymerase